MLMCLLICLFICILIYVLNARGAYGPSDVDGQASRVLVITNTPTPRTGESSSFLAFLTVSTEAPPSCATAMTRARKWAYYRRTIWLDLERVMGMDWEDIVTAQRRREKASASEAGSIVSVAAFGTDKPSLVAIATSGLTNLHRNIDSLLYIYAYYAYNFGRKCT